VVSLRGLFDGVVDIAVEPSGTVVVANQNNCNIVRVDPSTGVQTLITSGLVGLRGIGVADDGQIYVSSDPGSGVASSILQIDPVTGNQTVISTAGVFGFIGGLVQAP
jgi:streptogramin lyase